MKFLLTWSLFWWHVNFHRCRWWCPMIRQETCERLQTPNSTEGNIHHERWRCRDWKTPGKQEDPIEVEKNQKSCKCWFDKPVFLLPQPRAGSARGIRQRVRIDSFGSKELLFDHYMDTYRKVPDFWHDIQATLSKWWHLLGVICLKF